MNTHKSNEGSATATNAISSANTAPKKKGQGGMLYPFIIQAAGAGANAVLPVIPVPLPGSNFYVVSASGTVNIRPQGGQFLAYQPATGQSVAEGSEFPMLEIQNPNNFAVSGVLWIGYAGYIDNRLQQFGGQGSPTIFVPSNLANIGALQAYPFPRNSPLLLTTQGYQVNKYLPYSQLSFISRVGYLVRNLSAAGGAVIQVTDTNGFLLDTLVPGASQFYNTTDELTFFNPNNPAGVAACSISELWSHQ